MSKHLAILNYLRKQCEDSENPLGNGIQGDDEAVLRMMFLNYRAGNGSKGYRLTNFGLQYCKTFFQSWHIEMDGNFRVRPRHVLFLDRNCKFPYHLFHNHLTLFEGELAMRLKLVDDLDALIEMEKLGENPHVPARDKVEGVAQMQHFWMPKEENTKE